MKQKPAVFIALPGPTLDNSVGSQTPAALRMGTLASNGRVEEVTIRDEIERLKRSLLQQVSMGFI